MSVALDGLLPEDLDYPISVTVRLAYLPERHPDLQVLLDWTTNFFDSELGQLLQKQYGVSAVTLTHVEPESGNNAHQD